MVFHFNESETIVRVKWSCKIEADLGAKEGEEEEGKEEDEEEEEEKEEEDEEEAAMEEREMLRLRRGN